MNQSFTKQQVVSLLLMKNDLRFLYTLFKNIQEISPNSVVSSVPYIGLIIDGIEDWISSYNKSHDVKLNLPTFTSEERTFYEKMRSSIKLWENSYATVYSELERLYTLSKDYFSSLCIPFAKYMELYDIFGADQVDGVFCGNTILYSYYVPDYNYGQQKEEYIKNMLVIAGKYTALFQASNAFQTNNNNSFSSNDYGGFIKSPVGNSFSDRFVLFSLFCQINYIIKYIEEYIIDETTTKLRFAYILYHYVLKILPDINGTLQTNFYMDKRWDSCRFRNCMAHYKVGVALEECELIQNDPFFGLVQKCFPTCDYFELKSNIIKELQNLSEQLQNYLAI